MNYLLQLIIQRLYLLGKLIEVGFDINGMLTIFVHTIAVSRVTYTRCLPGVVNCLNETLIVLTQSFAAHTSGNSPTITIHSEP